MRQGIPYVDLRPKRVVKGRALSLAGFDSDMVLSLSFVFCRNRDPTDAESWAIWTLAHWYTHKIASGTLPVVLGALSRRLRARDSWGDVNKTFLREIQARGLASDEELQGLI